LHYIEVRPKIMARSLNDWNDVFNIYIYININGHQDLAVIEFGRFLLII